MPSLSSVFLSVKPGDQTTSFRALHAQMLYDPVKLCKERPETQIPALLFTISSKASLSWHV